MANNSEFPEHDKLQQIRDKSQACGEFLEWLQAEKKIVLARLTSYDELAPARYSIADLLAEFFDIDQDKLEDEKRKILEAMQRMGDQPDHL